MYFAEGGRWVGGREVCTHFQTPKSAIECAVAQGLDNFELILAHDKPRYEVVLTPEALGVAVAGA
jgi:hypothetical protein